MPRERGAFTIPRSLKAIPRKEDRWNAAPSTPQSPTPSADGATPSARRTAHGARRTAHGETVLPRDGKVRGPELAELTAGRPRKASIHAVRSGGYPYVRPFDADEWPGKTTSDRVFAYARALMPPRPGPALARDLALRPWARKRG